MTTQDKKTRVERLKDEPLFYYSTLRASVEQLDSLKATFQYLLAAYESNMDPVTKAQYAQMKQTVRTESLEELGRKARAEAQAPTLGSISFAHLEAQIAKTFPTLRTQASAEESFPQGQVITIDQLQMGHQQIIPGSGTSGLPASNVMPLLRKSGMPTDVHPEQVPAGTRQRTRKLTVAELTSIVPPLPITKVISITAGDLGESLYEVAEADLAAPNDWASGSVASPLGNGEPTAWGQAVVEQPNSPLAQTSTDTLLLELKRAGARSLVAQEINKVLKENSIFLTDDQLVDYMENKISREDLTRLAKRVSQEHAIEEPTTQAVTAQQSLIPSEFSLDQAGQLKSMVYSKDGLFSRILGPKLHRYGIGPVEFPDGKIHTRWTPSTNDNPHGRLSILTQQPSGIYQSETDQNIGVLLHLPPNDKYPQHYSVWLPIYLPSYTAPPPIYATQNTDLDYYEVESFNAEQISDITTRLIRYIIKWTAAVRAQAVGHGQGRS